MAAASLGSTKNHLLAALPAAEFGRLSPYLELVEMPLGKALYESGGRLKYVYFPTTCIVSLLYVMKDGASAEIAIVGNEGILGISLFMGATRRPAVRSCRAQATLTGSAQNCSKTSSGVSVRRCICCCVTPRR